MNKIHITNITLILIAAICIAQEPYLAPNAPEDKPVATDSDALFELLKPYVEMARRSYPQAKARFLKGLPPKHTFFITTRIYDKEGNTEQIFVVVKDIKKGKIKGHIASEIMRVNGYKGGDKFKCTEEDVIDWLIAKPDGTEEGNVVGKFLDALQERHIPLLIEMVIEKDGTVQSARFAAAQTRARQDVSYCVPDSIKQQAEEIIKNIKYDPMDSLSTKYTYLIYDVHENKIEKLEKDQSEDSGNGE